MNSVIRSILSFKTFLGLLITLFVLISFWFYDLEFGDANGIAAGITILPVITTTFLLLSILLILLAVIRKNVAAQNFILAVLSLAITFIVVEWFAGKWLAFQDLDKPKISGPVHSFIPDENLGYKPAPNKTIEGVKTIDGEEIYNISFETDSNSLRKIDLDTAHAEKFAQFFGCSMVFGEGVNSSETIPYFFGKLDSTYRPYNFAFSGYGPSQMLARLQKSTIDSIVKEKEGFGVYIFIPDHVNRVINTYTNYSYNHGNTPKYVLKEGVLIRDGTYATRSRFRNFIYEQMAKSNVLKLFNVGHPFRITEQHYELTAEVLLASFNEFKDKFQSDRFYVVIYPSNADNSAIVELLRSKGVKVLDYSNLFDPSAAGMAIKNDEHPTPKANRLLAQKLYQDITAAD